MLRVNAHTYSREDPLEWNKKRQNGVRRETKAPHIYKTAVGIMWPVPRSLGYPAAWIYDMRDPPDARKSEGYRNALHGCIRRTLLTISYVG